MRNTQPYSSRRGYSLLSWVIGVALALGLMITDAVAPSAATAGVQTTTQYQTSFADLMVKVTPAMISARAPEPELRLEQ
jgi:hypothetical protein